MGESKTGQGLGLGRGHVEKTRDPEWHRLAQTAQTLLFVPRRRAAASLSNLAAVRNNRLRGFA